MDSDSDLPVMEACVRTLADYDIPYEVRICPTQQTAGRAIALAKAAASEDVGVIIAAAGQAANLPGVLAASTILPVIAVPVRSGALAGTDSLYSIVRLPAGIPVATVAIDGAANSAILAAEILALQDQRLAGLLAEHKAKMVVSVAARQKQLEEKLNANQ